MRLFSKRVRNGIKICSEYFDDYRSAFDCGKTVDYERYEWRSRPEKCGPLAVFENVREAVDFLVSCGWLEVYDEKIDYSESNGEYRKVLFKCKYKKSKDVDLWDEYCEMSSNELPRGTILADEVMILEMIEWNDVRVDWR